MQKKRKKNVMKRNKREPPAERCLHYVATRTSSASYTPTNHTSVTHRGDRLNYRGVCGSPARRRGKRGKRGRKRRERERGRRRRGKEG